jgi:hypothetical protein
VDCENFNLFAASAYVSWIFFTDREPGVPDYPVPEIEFGYSPFELELTHKKHPDEVCLDFYDTAMETTSSELNMWVC